MALEYHGILITQATKEEEGINDDPYQDPPTDEEKIYEEFSKQRVRKIPRDSIEYVTYTCQFSMCTAVLSVTKILHIYSSVMLPNWYRTANHAT